MPNGYPSPSSSRKHRKGSKRSVFVIAKVEPAEWAQESPARAIHVTVNGDVSVSLTS